MTECVCGHDESWHEGVCNHGKHAARCPCKQFRPAGPIVDQANYLKRCIVTIDEEKK